MVLSAQTNRVAYPGFFMASRSTHCLPRAFYADHLSGREVPEAASDSLG